MRFAPFLAPFLALGLAALTAAGSAPAAPAQKTYAPTRQTCDGWPRAPIVMAPGLCAGLVTAPSPGQFAARQLKMPRTLLQLSARDWLVVDMGGWGDRQGSAWLMTAESGKPVKLTRLLSGLTMPHGLGRGPDGAVYIGEMSRIFRFDPLAANPAATVSYVVTGLPDNKLHANRHPLSNFIFDGDGSLLVNVGAPSDQCGTPGKPNKLPNGRCAESEGGEPTAGVRRYAYLGNGRWDARFTMFARGLRNSLALARHASGTLVQAENSIDYDSEDRPYEELNVLRAGAHYGWPYCFDDTMVAPVWAAQTFMPCNSPAHARPHTLLPPHSAPLGMLYYDGAMFPSLKGRLLISLHGYRMPGARIVAFDVGPDGLPAVKPGARYPVYRGGAVVNRPYPAPAAESRVLTPGWDLKPGLRPMGTPVGLAVARDGAIWVAEDKNATVLRIAVDRP
ncbi:MAG: PQQ-dependent sugar dehydrogenase [Caulobacteraceae bacterium]|nr:PQQ-dependent sugar dehydrogenase [Caulobacteraceae bacterium]